MQLIRAIAIELGKAYGLTGISGNASEHFRRRKIP
jgi:hypothetical protein